MDLPVGQMDLYHMEIHRNKEWTVPVVTGSGKEANRAEVVFDETLHVRTWIDGGRVLFLPAFKPIVSPHNLFFFFQIYSSLLYPNCDGKMLGVQQFRQ